MFQLAQPLSDLLPDVFIVGAAKAGTTSLHQYFRAHPQVFVPAAVKETNFMSFAGGMPRFTGPRDAEVLKSSISDLASYRRLYEARNQERVAVDVSPSYLYYAQAADHIAALCPRAKIVIVLRNPVEAAFSMYAMMRRDAREPFRIFWPAFTQSAARIAAGWEWAWDYQECFRYAGQVARFRNRFAESHLFIRRYEQLRDQPDQFYRDLCGFLDVAPIAGPQFHRRWNSAPRRRDMLAQARAGRWALRAARVAQRWAPVAWTRQLTAALDRPALALEADDRRRLVEYFDADIRALEKALSWDLSAWLVVDKRASAI